MLCSYIYTVYIHITTIHLPTGMHVDNMYIYIYQHDLHEYTDILWSYIHHCRLSQVAAVQPSSQQAVESLRGCAWHCAWLSPRSL